MALVAVNPPPGESDLDAAPMDLLRSLAGAEGAIVTTSAAWTREIFQARTGPDIGWLVLLHAQLVMGLEAIVAASGQSAEEGPDRGRKRA